MKAIKKPAAIISRLTGTSCIVLLNIGLISIAPDSRGQDVLDGVYVPEHTPTRKVIPYAPLREADVMWSKRIWRVIDLREKINHPFYYPTSPIQDRKALIDVIKTGITEGTITAYGDAVIDDEFKSPMAKEEVVSLFTGVDSIYTDDIDNPGELILKIVEKTLEADAIKQYWIKEDWFFDKQRSVLDVRIIGISPLQEKLDESGNFKGYEPLFWIYYPQARYVFANHEIFNRENDSERRTYEDLFWKRMFNSYIRKESNVYDRTIMEYTKGLDQLLESERIKDEIFNFEHDLWHF